VAFLKLKEKILFPEKYNNLCNESCVAKEKFFDISSYENTLVFLFLFSQIAKKKDTRFYVDKGILSRENLFDGPEQLFYCLK